MCVCLFYLTIRMLYKMAQMRFLCAHVCNTFCQEGPWLKNILIMFIRRTAIYSANFHNQRDLNLEPLLLHICTTSPPKGLKITD